MAKRKRRTPASAIFDRETSTQSRIRLALDSVQEAHELLEQASQTLSRVEGIIQQRRAVDALSNLLTRTWYTLRATANRLSSTRNGQSITADDRAPL